MADDEGLEITEIIKLDVERMDAVGGPATGIPTLMMKGLGGPPDEAAKATGCGCCPDCTGMAKSEPDMPAAEALAIGTELAKKHRDFSMDERKSLAQAGHALPDGSYPIPDADALRRAAILARSGHGNVSGARALIARRAREMGVPNPLEKKAKMSKSDGVSRGTEGDSGGAKGYISRDEADHLAKAAAAEAAQSSEQRITALEGELAKVMALPRTGGPVTSAPGATQRTAADDDLLAKARGYRKLAEVVTDPVTRAGYLDLAREAEEQHDTAQNKQAALTP